MRRPSGTSAMPARATSSGRRPRSERPSRLTSPPATGAAPMIACSVEDLPAPFGPISPTISPGSTSSESCGRRRRRRSARRQLVETSVRQLLASTGALAEVGGGDVEVARGSRPAFPRPASPLVEHVDAVADVHDQRHVVVDQEHAGAVVVAHGADDGGEGRHLGLGQAGRGLVHEHEARVGGERAGDPEPPLVAVRERRGRRVRARGEPEQLEQLVARRAARPRRGADAERGDLDVLAHAERAEGVRVLEGAREAGAPRRCGGQRVTSRPSSSTVPGSAGRSRSARSRASTCPRRSGRSARRLRRGRSSSVTSRSA